MNKEIKESVSFILKEYKRLKNKNRNEKLNTVEKKTLYKLSSFLGKNIKIKNN